MKMANTIEKFLSAKKNRPVLLAIIGFVLLYIYSRRSAAGSNSSGVPIGGGYVGGTDRTGNTGNPGNIGGVDSGSPNQPEPEPVSKAPIVPFAGVLENNPAVNSATYNGNLYEWINTRNAGIEVLPDGKIKLVVPAHKLSREGNNLCRPYVIAGAYGNYLSQDDLDAILSDGLEPQEGATTYLILYSTASTVEDHVSNLNKYVLNEKNTGQAKTNSAEPEGVIFSLTPATQTATDGEFVIPSQISRAGWIAAYHFLNHSLENPTNNRYGLTRYYVNADVPAQFGKHFTCLQWVYEWLDPYPTTKLWDNKQDINKRSAEWLAANEKIGKDYVLFAEITENNAVGQPGYDKAEQAFSLMFNRLKESDTSVTQPEHSRLYGDYFAGLHGGNMNVSFSRNSESLLIDCLSNQANARKLEHDGVLLSDGYYYRGYHTYRNIIHPAYLPNLLSHSPDGVYDLIFNLEKYAIATPTRRVGLMSTIIMEALDQDSVVGNGIFYALNLPGGRQVARASTIPHSFESLYTQAFWAYLLGNETDFVLWDSNVPMNINPYTFERSWYGGFEEGKTKYKAAGSEEWVTYNPSNPNHPQQLKTDDRSQFPELPQHAEGGAFAARLQIKRITEDEDLVSSGIWYKEFSYTVNGGEEESGYRDGDEPQGPNNGRVSARGYANPGQYNIVLSGKDRKPICMEAEGEDGKVRILQNPWASLADVTVFSLPGKTYTIRGNMPKIFKV